MRPGIAALLVLALGSCSAGPTPIRVCADPNNLPFSNRQGQGFENWLARDFAAGLGRPIQYVWWAQRRGFVRNTVGKQACDFWPGVASNLERLATTRPYYRSSYMFVTRADRALGGLTLDDPRLKKLSVGVQLVGDDGGNTPPAHALARRGITHNVHGYMLYGDYRFPNPPARIIDAVGKGDIDVGIAWGPLAGYFAKQSPTKLRVEPVTPWLDDQQWPMVYDISVGVRKDDPKLLRRIDAILSRDRARIGAELRAFGIPQL